MNAVRATRFMYYTPPPPAGAYKYIKDTGERRISIRFISRPVCMSTRSTRPEDHYFMSRAREPLRRGEFLLMKVIAVGFAMI